MEGDKDRDWNCNAMILRKSYDKVFRKAERWKMAAPVSDFLQGKYDGGEPAAMFAAIRTWEDYLNCYNMNHGADMLTDRLTMLYKPFLIYCDFKPWRSEILSNALRDGESSVELWYPVAKRPFETVVTGASLLPIIAYYRHKLREWRLSFQECKVCEEDFLTRSLHYELCSDKCRKVQAVETKREYDERAKGDKLEQLDEASYYYWHNRLRKLRKGKAANPDAEASFKAAMDGFRSEAVRRKGLVKRGEMKMAEFAGWLIEQQNEADRLMEGFTSSPEAL